MIFMIVVIRCMIKYSPATPASSLKGEPRDFKYCSNDLAVIVNTLTHHYALLNISGLRLKMWITSANSMVSQLGCMVMRSHLSGLCSVRKSKLKLPVKSCMVSLLLGRGTKYGIGICF